MVIARGTTYPDTYIEAESGTQRSEFEYDDNGNMTDRNIASGNYDFTYNAINKIATATDGTTTITYTYDGNGVLVKKVTVTGATSTTDLYIGDHFAKMNGTYRKTYMFAGKAVAVKNGAILEYLHSDHLGSASTATDIYGNIVSEQRYYPYGEVRWSSGTLPTDYTFTAQREDFYTQLYDFGARYYDPYINRFIQADSIVPGHVTGGAAGIIGYVEGTRLTPLTLDLGEFAGQIGNENRELLEFGPFVKWSAKTRQEHAVPVGPGDPQMLNRYAYVGNNPLRYVDPTGHDHEVTFEQTHTLDEIGDMISAMKELNRKTQEFAVTAGVVAILAEAAKVHIVAIGAFGLATEAYIIESLACDRVIGYLEDAVRHAKGDTITIRLLESDHPYDTGTYLHAVGEKKVNGEDHIIRIGGAVMTPWLVPDIIRNPVSWIEDMDVAKAQ